MNDMARPHSKPFADGLEGQRAFVIGAEHGVGPAVVSALESAGCRTLVDGGAAGDTVAFDRDDPVSVVDAAANAMDGLDIFVHCPPPVRNKPVMDMTPDELRVVIESELAIAALQMQSAARLMSKASYGRIIALASMSGKAGVHHNVAPYAAAKGGMLTFMRVLAAEMAGSGVTVNAIATALFDVQAATMTEEKRNNLLKQIPVGRFGRSTEAAHAVLYLASPLSGFVTGECLNLSGGRFMD